MITITCKPHGPDETESLALIVKAPDAQKVKVKSAKIRLLPHALEWFGNGSGCR